MGPSPGHRGAKGTGDPGSAALLGVTDEGSLRVLEPYIGDWSHGKF